MTKTYRINSPVSPIARWMPSLDAAKERFTASVLDGWRDIGDSDPQPVVTFEQSTEDEYGQPMGYEYTRCLIDGSWDSSIFEERPAWPTWDLAHGSSPALTMRATGDAVDCSHRRLTCGNTCTPREGVPEPRIWCAACGATWEPER